MRGILAMTLAATTMIGTARGDTDRPLPPAGDPETARVITAVSAIPLALDLGDFALAERAFAPPVAIDDTRLWGGAPTTMTPAALMAAWRGTVPGFDATWHALSDVRATVTGDTAGATAAVDARHWLDGRPWRPVGHYERGLIRLDGRWVVTRMVLRLGREVGERSLVEEAQRRAAGLRPRQDRDTRPARLSRHCRGAASDEGCLILRRAAGEPGGIRTLGHEIKSPVLYR